MAAEEAFDKVFRDHQAPEDVAEVEVDLSANDEGLVYVARVLVEAGLANTAGEARRLIDGGGVKIGGEPLSPKEYNVAPEQLRGALVQVGKRKFARIAE